MGDRRYSIGFSSCAFGERWEMLHILDVLDRFGYEGVELELDRGRFHPQVHDETMLREVGAALRHKKLRGVIGTGGRYVLTDQRHHPGAVSAEDVDRQRWIDFIKDAIRWALELESPCVMLHSGYKPPSLSDEVAWRILTESIGELSRYAEAAGAVLALEWHPEMFLRTGADFLRLAKDIASPALGCTLDVGHAHCTEDQALGDVIAEFAGYTRHVQLEDMKDRVHKHLRLGHGQLDFTEIFEAFGRTEFEGLVALEFNAGGIGGEPLARESFDFLRRIVPKLGEAA